MSGPGRRQVPPSTMPQYAAVPLNPPQVEFDENYVPQQHYLHDSQIASRPAGSISGGIDNRQYNGRQAVARGVATGIIGGAYGPYSYQPDQVRETGVNRNSRFSSSSSDSLPTTIPREPSRPPTQSFPPPAVPSTMTIPRYMSDFDFDEALHNPDPQGDFDFTLFSWRGWVNASAIILIIVGLIMLFIGFPIIDVLSHPAQPFVGFNAGGINGSGQIPLLPNLPRMIDLETPESAWTRIGDDGLLYELTFSDEFNTDGRTFYPGDDPFWEAEDLHYWPTNNVEWYDPSAITTEGGKLVITMTEQRVHDLNFQSGMLTSWNKLCFNTGYVEVSISMPGEQNAPVPGLWPGAWTLGNLGRAGHGATNDGMWPYSYDSCDLGTFLGQIGKDGQPVAVATAGKGGVPLSSQPGQKLSACTCPGSDHPGPSVNVGRGVPEIDILEAQIDTVRMQGQVSQSFQTAPYDMGFVASQDPGAMIIYNSTQTFPNSYKGGPYQQALSSVSYIDNQYFGGGDDAFASYGFELWSDPNRRDDGYITWWYNGQKTWKATSALIGPNSDTQISQRLISEEPMYLILNLGMSPDFQKPDFKNLKFPAKMYVDYVRIYQRKGIKHGMTCNPPNRPTTDYINKHLVAYTNADLIRWSDANFTFPRNSLYDGC